ncbi:MAG: hypothetical protein ABI267_09635 [Ginsengibacter sp.]
MKRTLLIVIATLLILSSCKKEPVVINTDKIVVTQLRDEVYGPQYASKHTNGDFYVFGECAYSLNMQGLADKHNSLLLSGSFYNQQDSVVPGGNVSIDTFHFSAGSSYEMQEINSVDNSFFGRDITVMLAPPAGQAPQFTAPLYLPKTLFAQVGSSDRNIFKPSGDTLFWNADDANKNGLIISFDFDPDNYLNNRTLSYNPISKTIAGIADIGIYIIPSNVLSLFPSGGYINIRLKRDATSLVSYKEFKYILHSSVSTGVFSLKIP